MGTNFYLKLPFEADCANDDHRTMLHVGKSSGGWEFTFHSIPERGLTSLDDWLRLMLTKGHDLVTEYGESYWAPDFIELVHAKRNDQKHDAERDAPKYLTPQPSHRDKYGHYFVEGDFS